MQRGHTMSELLVALAVAAMLACVSVPGIAWVDGRAAVSADARSLAFVLRARRRAPPCRAPPCACASMRQGCGYVCEETADAVTTVLGRGDFHGPCATNYPGGAVEFCTEAGLAASPASRAPGPSPSKATAPTPPWCCRWAGESVGSRRPRPDPHRSRDRGGGRARRRDRRLQGRRDRGSVEHPRRRARRRRGRRRGQARRPAQLAVQSGRRGRGRDVLSYVFPHADPGRNSPDAAYQAEAQAGCPAGTFITVKHAACGT